MNPPIQDDRTWVGTDSVSVEDAFEKLVERWEQDGEVDVESLLQETYPEFADELRPLLQMVGMLQATTSADVTQIQGSDSKQRVGMLAEPPHPQSIGDYQILGEIGRGGMGVVYEAQQISLERRVALKVLPFASLSDPHHRIRFRNEARAAASVCHPNIVPVFATGEQRGVHYLAMQLIDGRALDEVIRSHTCDRTMETTEESLSSVMTPATVDARQDTTVDDGISRHWSDLRRTNAEKFYAVVAELGAQLADALAHAHECGVIHRDVKPSNVLIDETGKPWLTDFGLAQLSNESRITRTGDMLGTMRYMSPEQMSGDVATLDHRTDVYSLGATLYELVSLRAAHDAEDRAKLLQDVRDREPPPLASLCSNLPRPLATIIHKAMQKDVTLRFESAQAMAADLRRFLKGQRIAAKPPTLTQRLQRWVRRNRIVAGAAVAATLFCLGFGLFLERQHAQQLNVANQELQHRYRRAKEDLNAVMRSFDHVVIPLAFKRNLDKPEQDSIETALGIYTDVANRHRTDPGFMSEAMLAFINVGIVKREFGEYDLAFDAMRSAVAVARQRLAMESSDQAKADLAHALMYEAMIAYYQGRVDVAQTAYVESERLLWETLTIPCHETSDRLANLVAALLAQSELEYSHGSREKATQMIAAKLKRVDALCQQFDLPDDGASAVDAGISMTLAILPAEIRSTIEQTLGRELPVEVGDPIGTEVFHAFRFFGEALAGLNGDQQLSKE